MKDENPFIVLAKALECGIDRAVLPKSLPVLQNRKFRHPSPRISRGLAGVVRARIIADEYPAKLGNTRTRLHRTQCLSNRTGSIEGRDDYRRAHASILTNYFRNAIHALILSCICQSVDNQHKRAGYDPPAPYRLAHRSVSSHRRLPPVNFMPGHPQMLRESD